jgi:glycosyltransferase involved in cell wall biosynthesis
MKRILFLSEYYPFDIRRDVFGVFKRMRMLVDAAKSLGQLDILFFQPPWVDSSQVAVDTLQTALQRSWDSQLSVFLRTTGQARRRFLLSRIPFWFDCAWRGAITYHSAVSLETSHAPSLEAVARCLDRGPDVILAFRLGSMAPLLRLSRRLPPICFDVDDVEHVKALRTARQTRDPVQRAKIYAAVPLLLWSEYRAMNLADRTLVCSDIDLDRFKRFPRSAQRVVVPNAVTIPRSVSVPGLATLLFLGAFLYWPNVAAAETLIREVWPRVRRNHPDARLVIAGAEPERIPSYTSKPEGVEFAGFVEDLDALYRRVQIVCCPIKIGGGTRIKILEAAAHGKAIVSTTVGAEGIGLHDGREILIRDDPGAFAEACSQILGEPRLAHSLGAAAREAIRQRYDRSTVVGRVRDVISAMCESR